MENLIDGETGTIGKLDRHRAVAGLDTDERQCDTRLATCRQLNGLHRALADGHCIAGLDGQIIGTGRPIGIGDVEPQIAVVARREETRQAGSNDDRIADDDILHAVPDAGFRPCDGHHPCRAVELRNIEGDLRLALAVQLHRTGEESDQLFLRRACLQRHAATVTARPQSPGRAERTIDQTAIDIADFQPQTALAEIPVVGRGRLVTGEIENANIDGRNRHIGILIGPCPRYLQRDIERLARQCLFRRIDGDRKITRFWIDLQPRDPDRPHRHAVFTRFAGAIERCGNVRACTPIRSHRDFDLAAIFGDACGLDRDQLLGTRHHHQLAGISRRDFQLGGIADLVARLVERDFQRIRRFSRSGGYEPAGIEFDAGGRAADIGGFDLEAITAPLDGNGNTPAIGRHVDGAIGDLARAGDRFITPGIAVAIPLVIPLDLDELPRQPLQRLLGAGFIDQDDVEIAHRTFRQVTGKFRLDADPRAISFHRQRQVALDRPSTRLLHPDDNLGIDELGR
ncbi:hypothetical protein D3C73_587560 [compost metagenome]